MSDVEMQPRSFADLKSEVGGDDENRFAVRSRGRPEMGAKEAKDKQERREAFGSALKELREKRGLTLAAAAEEAGIASARKLSQYETKCYPPGWVLTALAPVYGTTAKHLAALKLSNSDPYTFAALSGNLSASEFSQEGV